jgi:hypothetical protein
VKRIYPEASEEEPVVERGGTQTRGRRINEIYIFIYYIIYIYIVDSESTSERKGEGEVMVCRRITS